MDKHEALTVIRKNYPHVANSGSYFETALRELIPELKESEDERIRKHLIDIVETYWGTTNDPGKAADLAWLERQKDLDKMIVVSPEVWDTAIADAYENGKKDGEKQKEQKPAEWSEKDIEMYAKVLFCFQSLTFPTDKERHAIMSWLKSLRPPQYCENCKLKRSVENWKPSYEQMGMLLAVINDPNNAGAESCRLMLQSLYADLQKLLSHEIH